MLNFIYGTAQIVPRKQYHLVAFVRLQGQPNFNVTLSDFEKFMNDPEESFSFKYFLKTSSYGKLDYQFVSVKRADSDTVPYYYDIMPEGYYAALSPSNPNGYVNQQEGYDRAHRLTDRYIKFLNDNLAPDVMLDGDNDGFVDFLSFSLPTQLSSNTLFRYGGNWAGGIPHDNRNSLRIKGLGVSRFCVATPDSWLGEHAAGIFKHEVGHNLGNPDFYDSNHDPLHRHRYRNLVGNPALNFNIMSGVSQTYGAYPMWAHLGFLNNDDVKILNQNGTYRLNSLFSSTPDNVAFRINSPNSKTEYFILEYRSANKHAEWWHNDEGLLISLVNPQVGGNARGTSSRAYELYYLRDNEGNALFNNYISLDQKSMPKLALSTGQKAGFSLNNIRVEAGQLVFDLVFEDDPFISVVEYPDVLSRNAQTINWIVETNPSNAYKWNATSNVSWLTLTKDYENGILNIQSTQNNIFSQRNAIITLTADGAENKKAYLIQRGTSSASAFWMPEAENNTVFIEGEENSHNIRVLGDLRGNWSGGNSDITPGPWKRRVLHNSVNPIYAHRNNTDSHRTVKINFNLTDGTQKSFDVTQRPAINPEPVYSTTNGFLPTVDDGKWYFVRTERAKCTQSNFLRPVRSGSKFIVGTGELANNDSLLWTIESNGINRVILRNKAMGYIDLNNLENTNVTFSSVKLSNNLTLRENISTNFYSDYIGYSFQGNSNNVLGLHVATNNRIITNYFRIDDNCTFFFNEPNAFFYKRFGGNVLKALRGYDEFTVSNDINQLKQNIQAIDDNQNSEVFNAHVSSILTTISAINNTLIDKVTSLPGTGVEKWFNVSRYLYNVWGQTTLNEELFHYLNFSDRNAVLEHAALNNGDDRFAFKFEKQASGFYHIVNKANLNLKISVATGSIRILSYSPVNFEIRPIYTFRGLKFVFINSANQQYLKYNLNRRELSFVNSYSLNNLVSNRSYLFNLESIGTISSTKQTTMHDQISSFKPYVQNRTVKYPLDDIAIDVYNLKGARMLNDNLPNGIYIVKVNNRGYKVAVY